MTLYEFARYRSTFVCDIAILDYNIQQYDFKFYMDMVNM